MFADDTVIYYENESFEIIQQRLNKEMVSIASYFTKNELVINLKKNKTESMLFGTAKKLSAVLEIYYNHHLINHTTRYKYLGTVLDPTLNLNDHFASVYKKASSRLRLLSKLRENLTICIRRCLQHDGCAIISLQLRHMSQLYRHPTAEIKIVRHSCKQYCLWPG